METFQQKSSAYIREILDRKVRLILSVLISLFLFIVSSHYLYDGISKRFLIYTLLCLLTGALIVCPRPRHPGFCVPLVFFYLLLIPRKMFQRMELPLHDMSKLRDGALFANILIILLVYAILLLVFQRVRFALGGGGIVLLILSLVNYYVNQFQGGNLNFSNLLAAGTALTVLDSYHFSMTSELWYSILYFCFFIALGFWCDIPGKGLKYHGAVTAASLVYCLAFYFGFWQSDYLSSRGIEGVYWSVQENGAQNGFLIGFGISIKDLNIAKPSGYSDSAVAQIIHETEESYQVPEPVEKDSSPNIILIMNEAWSDLRVLGNVETSEPFMPFTDSLTENTIRGNLFVEILGGLTANTEFEVLTGDTLAFLTPTAIPYQLEISHDMYSLARVLKEQGYQTIAMHPSGAGAWNRNLVYDYFGFDTFIDVSRLEVPVETFRSYISDECDFNEIIWRYEHRDMDKPFFLFNVTIQNHGGYYHELDNTIHLEKIGNTAMYDNGFLDSAETYLNTIKVTDEAFENLLAYFSEVEEPTIICMFGDHQPLLGDIFYQAVFEGSGLSETEQNARKFITPYVIWSNYDREYPEYGDMSSNYLGAAVLECAGVELPPYYKYLLQLQKQYPEISRRTIEALAEEESVQKYQILQYSQLMDREIPNPVFTTGN